MVEAATAWRERWAAQGDPAAPRKTLAGWIAKECFHENPPTGYQPKEKPAKAKTQRTNTKASTKAEQAAEPPKPAAAVAGEDDEHGLYAPSWWPKGRMLLRVVDSKVTSEHRDTWLTLIFEVLGDEQSTDRLRHGIFLESYLEKAQKAGQATLTEILGAADISSINDSDELHGVIMAAEVIDGGVRYQRATDGEIEPWISDSPIQPNEDQHEDELTGPNMPRLPPDLSDAPWRTTAWN